MKRTNLKPKLSFILFLIIFVSGLVFDTLSMAQDLTGKSESSAITKKAKDGTRIVITTSGLARFNSYELDSPQRLVIEFQTRNILSKMDNKVMVNQGVIKRITSEYFGGDQKRLLKSLTFELTQRAPYKIWQEADAIVLDIQTPPEISVFPEEGKEIFANNKTKDKAIRRLEAMGAALPKTLSSHLSSGTANKVIAEFSEAGRKGMASGVFWFMGLALIFGLGPLPWLLWNRHRLILDKNFAIQEIAKFKSELQEKNKLLEREEIVRKTIENTSLVKGEELEQLKLELQKEAKLLEQEEKVRKIIEEKLFQKEKECERLKNLFKSFKETLVKNGVAKELSSPEGERRLWIPGKSQEKRQFSRLDLRRDYNRTVILRIESQNKSGNIKSFAGNIGMGGLYFDTKKEFKENEMINLRLFFFGDKVPIMKVKAEVIWKRAIPPVNYYGVSFAAIEEKHKAELSRYILTKSQVSSHKSQVKTN
ncbi:MAG: PilZ domain-containing protein [Actinobacteria bacterium]|nr:PilZ domain-containing protein [Actinomycetota bacterium]